MKMRLDLSVILFQFVSVSATHFSKSVHVEQKEKLPRRNNDNQLLKRRARYTS